MLFHLWLTTTLGAVMSANEHTETVFECIREGAEDYLLKPVTKKEVQNIWQHVWRRQQQAQSGRSPVTVSPLPSCFVVHDHLHVVCK